jgi:hypothetical protein
MMVIENKEIGIIKFIVFSTYEDVYTRLCNVINNLRAQNKSLQFYVHGGYNAYSIPSDKIAQLSQCSKVIRGHDARMRAEYSSEESKKDILDIFMGFDKHYYFYHHNILWSTKDIYVLFFDDFLNFILNHKPFFNFLSETNFNILMSPYN